ncbi:hypothetical protein QYF61_008758 [Mycteria americana]|uniref:Uncharacterized protein n=1 Tax=Mycteria americana TaxID=33587 RepID=A0AAN7NGA3_MYCAM|nr:hypothetical protein QYF61_008758 [Mycteria americana]
MRNGGYCQFIVLLLCCSFLLMLFPCSNMGSFHWVQSFRKGLLQHGSPTGPQVLPERTCSSVGSSPRAAVPARGLLQRRLSTGCSFLQSTSTCSSMGSSIGCRVDICSTMVLHGLQRDNLSHHAAQGDGEWGLRRRTPHTLPLLRRGVLHRLQVDVCSTVNLHGLQGDNLPHHGLHQGLQGNLCSGTWSTSSQNRIGWKRPLRSSSPTVNLTLPRPPLYHVPKHLIQTSFKYFQGWRLNHFPGQPVPMLDNPFSEVKFPNIQSKPPLAQLEAISSRPMICYLAEETDPHLSIAITIYYFPLMKGKQYSASDDLVKAISVTAMNTLKGTIPLMSHQICTLKKGLKVIRNLSSKSVSFKRKKLLPVPMLDNPSSEEIFPNMQSKPPLAQLEAISSHPITCYLGKETDPHLSTTSFQTLHQLRCSSLDALQHLNVFLVVRGPKPNTVFEVRPHQCRVQGYDHFPSPSGHTVSDTSQDAIGFLGHLGTLLAHVQAAVDQHSQVLLCWAAF